MSYIQLLRNNPNFALLWLAQVISLTGDWFNTIVLSTIVAKYSDGSGLAVSLYLMSRFLPPLIVGPFAGVLVDRFDRQRILVYSNVLRTGIVLAFLLATTSDLLWLIYALTIAQFTVSALFEPGQSAITPALVNRDDLVLANTLASITWSAMLAFGAIAGGIVAALFGSVTALVFDAVTFAVAGLLIAAIKVPDQVETYQPDDVDGREERSFIDGIRYLIRNPGTAAILLIKGGGSIGNVDTLMTIYATQIFVWQIGSELSLGIMFSAFGIGAIIGPLLLNRINDGSVFRMRRLVIVGFALAVMGWVLLGIAGSLIMIAAALVIRAMGGSANWTYSSVIIQKTVPDRFLGRVFSLDLAAFQLATVLSIVVHGAVIDMLASRTNERLFIELPEILVPESWLTLKLSDLAVVSFGTAVASMIPFVLWTLAVMYMESRRRNAPIALNEAVGGR